MTFGGKKKPDPPPVETAPPPKIITPRLEITTSTTARIVGQNFKISPADEHGVVHIHYAPNPQPRYHGYWAFDSMLLPARLLPELLALLGEAAKVNCEPPSKVTRDL